MLTEKVGLIGILMFFSECLTKKGLIGRNFLLVLLGDKGFGKKTTCKCITKKKGFGSGLVVLWYDK